MQNKSLKSGEVIYRITKKDYDLWRPKNCIGRERFDSSNGEFNTLYCAHRPLICFLETMQCFRSGMPGRQGLSLILDQPDEEVTGLEGTGSSLISDEWRTSRELLQITFNKNAEFLDLMHHETIQFLRSQKSIISLMPSGEDFDLSTVTGAQRGITQEIANIAHNNSFNGIYYTSRFGANLECYAVFDNVQVKPVQRIEINTLDEDYQEALRIFSLRTR